VSYNATGCLCCEFWKQKNIFFYFVKRSNVLWRWRCSWVLVLAPWDDFMNQL
jgi:hypothetical protein